MIRKIWLWTRKKLLFQYILFWVRPLQVIFLAPMSLLHFTQINVFLRINKCCPPEMIFQVNRKLTFVIKVTKVINISSHTVLQVNDEDLFWQPLAWNFQTQSQYYCISIDSKYSMPNCFVGQIKGPIFFPTLDKFPHCTKSNNRQIQYLYSVIST